MRARSEPSGASELAVARPIMRAERTSLMSSPMPSTDGALHSSLRMPVAYRRSSAYDEYCRQRKPTHMARVRLSAVVRRSCVARVFGGAGDCSASSASSPPTAEKAAACCAPARQLARR